MKHISLILIALLFAFAVKAQQTIAICKEKQGCEIANVNLSRVEIDKILGKQNFLTAAGKNAILVLNNCNSAIEEKKTTLQLHQAFGGKVSPKTLITFDLKKYLIEKGCVKCPNPTQKISFSVNSSTYNGAGFFYLNINASEAYMPNQSYQSLMPKGEDMGGAKIDAVLKNEKSTMYTITPEGKKYKIPSAIGATAYLPGSSKDANYWEKVFKQLKPTGQKKYFLNTKEFVYEYTGKMEGLAIKLWLYSSNNVCLPIGKPTAIGFYNVGYFNANGKTYLLAEANLGGYTTKVTGLSAENYSFNPVGYEAIGTQ